LNLTDEHRAYLARFLREVIETDCYPLSPRVRRLNALLTKIDPSPASAAEPLSPPMLPQGEQHLLTVAPNTQRHQHGQAGCLLVEANAHNRAV
jgi:hypothetical protein